MGQLLQNDNDGADADNNNNKYYIIRTLCYNMHVSMLTFTNATYKCRYKWINGSHVQ